MSFVQIRNVSERPLVALGSASEYGPRRTAALQHPLMGSSFPSALEASGSDQHRVCLARLCSASRLSQPPDGLFLPSPSGFVSRRWHPWDSPLQRFGPLTRPTKPLGPPSPLDVAHDRACMTVATEPARCPGSETVRPGVATEIRCAPASGTLRNRRTTGSEMFAASHNGPCGPLCEHGPSRNAFTRSSRSPQAVFESSRRMRGSTRRWNAPPSLTCLGPLLVVPLPPPTTFASGRHVAAPAGDVGHRCWCRSPRKLTFSGPCGVASDKLLCVPLRAPGLQKRESDDPLSDGQPPSEADSPSGV
jgi:hypothetical protein